MKIYILAQGQSSRWKSDSNRNTTIELPSEYKQLTPLGDETIITRTIRQVFEYDPIVIANGDFVPYIKHLDIKFQSLREPTGCILEGICRTKNEWEGHRVVFLLGDVIYSNELIRMILQGNGDSLGFYGRNGSNKWTGKEAKEIFAVSFSNDRLIQNVIWNKMRSIWFTDGNNRAKLWTLFHHRNNHIDAMPTFHEIDDYTDDIDSPEEYEQFFEKLKECALEDDARRE